MPFANNNGVKIHYEVEGQGPPLILQHGAGGNLESWYERGYVQELAKDYRLILVDARGHGRSDKPHESAAWRPDIVARDYVAILDDLGVQKAGYFGYSMGGRIGFQAIAKYALPRFSSLIIGGATPYGFMEVEKSALQERIAALELSVKSGINAYITFLEKIYGTLSPEMKASELANDPQALLTMFKSTVAWPSVENILPAITTPCLVFAGDADPRYAGARECSLHMPKATFISFPHLNHLQCLDRSDLVLPHVKKFLAEASKSLLKE